MRWSVTCRSHLGEPEQLRRNMTPASEGLYVGDGTPGSFGGDEQMEAPPDDLLTQLDSAARAGAHAGMPLRQDIESHCINAFVLLASLVPSLLGRGSVHIDRGIGRLFRPCIAYGCVE